MEYLILSTMDIFYILKMQNQKLLVVSVTKDEFVNKGGSIAVAEMLAALDFSVELICYRSPKNKLHNKISKNIKVYNCFNHKDFPIIERIVDHGRDVKLFQHLFFQQLLKEY